MYACIVGGIDRDAALDSRAERELVVPESIGGVALSHKEGTMRAGNSILMSG